MMRIIASVIGLFLMVGVANADFDQSAISFIGLSLRSPTTLVVHTSGSDYFVHFLNANQVALAKYILESPSDETWTFKASRNDHDLTSHDVVINHGSNRISLHDKIEQIENKNNSSFAKLNRFIKSLFDLKHPNEQDRITEDERKLVTSDSGSNPTTKVQHEKAL